MEENSQEEMHKRAREIGVAIAAHNAGSVIERCLRSLGGLPFRVTLFDDGSRDDTVVRARAVVPSIRVIEGDGSYWWAGGTRAAVEDCFAAECKSVLMLNPDVAIEGADVLRLAAWAEAHKRTIPAALVVSEGGEDRIAWAGSRFVQIAPLVFTSRYIKKAGEPVTALRDEPFPTDEVHGRGVLVTRKVFEELGSLDAAAFPHYGADNDYSLRARARGIAMFVCPRIRSRVLPRHTGMAPPVGGAARRLAAIFRYLTRRKNGDALRVLWRLYSRHVPIHAVVPTYCFNVGLNILRRLY